MKFSIPCVAGIWAFRLGGSRRSRSFLKLFYNVGPFFPSWKRLLAKFLDASIKTTSVRQVDNPSQGLEVQIFISRPLVERNLGREVVVHSMYIPQTNPGQYFGLPHKKREKKLQRPVHPKPDTFQR